MKKLMIMTVVAVLIMVSGCFDSYRPNTRKGHALDEINKHTRRIEQLNPVIYEQNEKLIPAKTVQLGDVQSWQNRMKARMSGMKGGQ